MIKIYFVQAGEAGPIKIGRTQHPIAKRLKSLQVGCPWPIRLLAIRSGNFLSETAVHRKFKDYRISGEWFLPDKEILDFIEEVRHPDFRWPVLRRKITTKISRPKEGFASGGDYRPIEPYLRANLLMLADSYARNLGIKLSTVSTRLYGDSRFFDNLAKMADAGNVAGKHVSFMVDKYDEIVDKFCAIWPETAIFPDLYIDERLPTETAPINEKVAP